MSAVMDQRLARVDPLLVGAIVCLLVIGTIMVGSASISNATDEFGQPLYYLNRHIGALGIGFAAALVILFIPTRTWFETSGWIALLSLALLVAVLIPGLGLTTNGSTRWLGIGPARMQPSEFARLGLLVYLASYAVRHQKALSTSFTSLLRPLLVVGLAVGLLLLEPDFGAAVVLTATCLGVLFVGGSRWRDMLVTFAAAATVLAFVAKTATYRVDRLLTYLDPFGDPLDKGYQLVNSLIGIGRGGWFGAGLGDSIQKLNFLPYPHSDFVFAVLAEEFGFIGSTIVIALFAVVVFRILAIGQRAIDAGLGFQGLLCIGIGLLIAAGAFVNIGVNIGLLPTKGLTLPLMSYGRSSLIATLIALALVIRIRHELVDGEARAARKRSKA